MTLSKKPNVHIGYYLKTVDNLLTRKRPGITAGVLLDVVKQFTSLSTSTDLLNRLKHDGLVVDGATGLELSTAGEKTYASSLQMQKEFREKAMLGIARNDYEIVINTLSKMIDNLSD